MVFTEEERKASKKRRDREYRLRNIDKIKEYDKSPNRIKCNTISRWKRRGIIHSDFDTLYDLYINTDKCMYCEKVFGDAFERCLDHDHQDGSYRAVLCRACNSKDILNN